MDYTHIKIVYLIKISVVNKLKVLAKFAF